MNQRHPPPPSHGRRQQHPGAGKPARPGLHRRVHSHQPAQSQLHASSKAATAAAKKAAREEAQLTDDEEGMAGLPQFCMTCERQIVNPGNSTLFCSRACQRRDSAKPTPTSPLLSPAINTPAPSYFDAPFPDILPQRSPTVLRPLSFTFPEPEISLPSASSEDESESEGNQASNRLSTTGPPSLLDLAARPARPTANRASTSTLPSLSHTPSSSVGTAASFHARTSSKKSVDLVIPTFSSSAKSDASTLTSFQAGEAPAFAKRSAGGGGGDARSPAQGSLMRRLFEHEAMVGEGGGGAGR